jgi:hypothetical protein
MSISISCRLQVHNSAATGDDFIDAVMNTSTGGSNGGEDATGDVLLCDL